MRIVTAGLMVEHGRVLVAQRAAGDALQFKWEFPGGKVEAHETPEECLKRELREEFGIEVLVGSLVATSDYDYGHGTLRLMAYSVSRTAGDLVLHVHQAVRWVAPEELGTLDLLPADIPIAAKLRELSL